MFKSELQFTATGFVSFDYYSWYSSEGDASPPKQKSDWSQRVGFSGKMLWILISVVGSIYFLQLASLGQL